MTVHLTCSWDEWTSWGLILKWTRSYWPHVLLSIRLECVHCWTCGTWVIPCCFAEGAGFVSIEGGVCAGKIVKFATFCVQPVCWVSQNKYAHISWYLLVLQDDSTPLLASARTNHSEITAYLISMDADVNATDKVTIINMSIPSWDSVSLKTSHLTWKKIVTLQRLGVE